MIEGIFGLPGQGKTYEGVRRLLLEADQGRQCYSITPIDHPNVEFVTFDECLDPFMPPGLIFWDEVHLKLGANDFRALKPEWYEKLSQTRKDGHDLIYTSQHESKVLKQLRDNTNYGWVTNAWGGWRGHPMAFSASAWEMHKLRRGKPADRYVHRFSMRVARAYDTRFAIKAEAAVVERPTLSVAPRARTTAAAGRHSVEQEKAS
ncbi:zonular occludens toxin domain-containing protein [Cellulomonas sp. 73-145]|uniref:zonular occludens toxin domain-containing protein n=1 Tax=Cellulomonas sp. 73-145 TaxID=1895739 RepID=UPI001AD2F82E|nr:zonular occludens toxin domain-containing protein [Cellulomonas sp. 73-145]MBN9326850.1 hypothetical protein [Cellulomonas sp.]